MAKGEHVPSKYRAMIKESKSGKGRPVDKLIEDARSLQDPYYQALALFSISSDKRLDENNSRNLAKESIQLSEKEERPWRKAELLVTICKKAKNDASSTHDLIRSQVMEKIWTIPPGKGRSDAVTGCINFLGCQHIHELLRSGVSDPGFEMETCKPLLRYWAKECSSFQGISLEDILKVLGTMPPGLVKVKLHGYLHVQLARSGSGELATLEIALANALKLSGDDRMQSIKYLADQSSNLDELELIATSITELGEPGDESRLFTALAGNADKAGHPDLALDWFATAKDILADVDEPGASAGTLLNIAKGLQRLGKDKRSMKIFELALEDAKDDEKLRSRIMKAMGKTPADEDSDITSLTNIEKITSPKTSSRHILGLYDTYEGGIKPVHIRMVARAAPLCVAYDLDLALFGFPTEDLDRLVAKVLADTNIGKGGQYLKDLMKQGRITHIPCTQKVPPNSSNWPKFSLPVATTSRPKNSKARTLGDALKIARKDHPEVRLCLIMGLGRKGLPRSLLDNVEHHVELTGSNVSLETSTAMGIIARELGGL